jgi:hypothetical protein
VEEATTQLNPRLNPTMMPALLPGCLPPPFSSGVSLKQRRQKRPEDGVAEGFLYLHIALFYEKLLLVKHFYTKNRIGVIYFKININPE